MPTEALLAHQHRSVHDTPRSAGDHDRVLRSVVASALRAQRPDGGLELDPDREDVGDTCLGVTSLLLLACRRDVLEDGDRRAALTAARRSLEFFLRRRVFRHDNPGYPFYRRRNSGLPYARYMLADGRHPFGDWPSTVWALLSADNVIRLGRGLVDEELVEELLAVAEGYWAWLTRATFFNAQDSANQALGAVVGCLMLAQELDARGRGEQAELLRADALARYDDLRAQWIPDRGVPMPREHAGGWDGNYGPITLSFLAQAHRVTGDPRFAEAGDGLARYLDGRLSVTGFDVGGPRYSEQHAAFEGVLGLRYFGNRIGADLGRYRGNDRLRYLMDAEGAGDGSAAPDGHFAFVTVWTIEDDTAWVAGPVNRNRRFDLRRGRVSVAFGEDLAPRLVDVNGTIVVPAVLQRQHGIGPLYRDGSRTHLLTRPLGPVRSREVTGEEVSAKLVHTSVATRAEVLLTTRALYLTDGTVLHLVVFVDAARLPAGAEPALLVGLPYATPASVPGRAAKILEVRGQDGAGLSFGQPGECLIAASITAGRIRLSGNGPLRASGPEAARGNEELAFSSPMALRSGLEQVSFAISPDPRGYGNPDAAWTRVLATDCVEVLGGTAVPGGGPGSDWRALAVSWTPAEAPPPAPVVVEPVVGGLIVDGPARVFLGPPEGDEQGEPVLRLLGRDGAPGAVGG